MQNDIFKVVVLKDIDGISFVYLFALIQRRDINAVHYALSAFVTDNGDVYVCSYHSTLTIRAKLQRKKVGYLRYLAAP